ENASNLLVDVAEKTKEAGQKGILEYEIKKIEKEIENLLPVLGSEVYSGFREKKLEISKDFQEIHGLLEEIQKKEKLMAKKEKELEGVGTN
ncbi:MAG: hypothetical protein JW969_13105, partial [Spirochaetales bacterium]|nr:hypothetical protein [Spirochaetales bacterium]